MPECECPDTFLASCELPDLNGHAWIGDQKDKGLGIFCFRDYHLLQSKNYDPEIKLVLPLVIQGPSISFTLIAFWTLASKNLGEGYVQWVWKAVHHYEDLLHESRVLLIGDFNSNKIWDQKRQSGNHSDVVRFLEDRQIQSVYHHHHQQEQGKEQHPTFYQYRHHDKPYHIDYCFASSDFIRQIKDVSIGSYDNWHDQSDHVPLIVTFK